ncbi:hypothetical protein [Streptomyces neyagawaensis]|uniref:Uncharacterized protein n=1 Tax=Streptomyces neyagawaensis TaxID=42238 RepID=A0ABV3ATT4_9ACTN
MIANGRLTSTNPVADLGVYPFPSRLENGGTAQKAVTDARGRTTELRLLHSRSADAAYDTTSYAYSPRGELINGGKGQTWDWNSVTNEWTVSNTMQRVPLGVK